MKTRTSAPPCPGPKARALIARDAAVTSPSYPRDYAVRHVHGGAPRSGTWTATASSTSPPASPSAAPATATRRWSQAIKDAAGQVPPHLDRDFWHEGQVRLGERDRRARLRWASRRCASSPSRDRGGGGRPQAGPVRHRAQPLHRLPRRLPRPHDGRARVHVEQVHPAAAASSPTMPGVTHVPYPNPYRPLFAGADQGKAVLDYIEHVHLPVQRAARRGGRHPRRADAGRGRLPRAAGRLPAGPARRSATATASC